MNEGQPRSVGERASASASSRDVFVGGCPDCGGCAHGPDGRCPLDLDDSMSGYQRRIEELLKMIGCNDANVRPQAARVLEGIIRGIAMEDAASPAPTQPEGSET